tara:strand:+ start:90 stop:416 length:327 start_codon:yes stop_codon:yes gene_type:complete
MRKQIELLKDHTNILAKLPYLRRIGVKLNTVDMQGASIVVLKPVESADQRRFARARRTTDHNTLTLMHVQVDVGQCLKITKELVDLFGNNDRFSCHVMRLAPAVCDKK